MRDVLPEGPDPGREVAVFLGWLKRNGGAKSLTTCERKLRHLRLGADEAIGPWGSERVRIANSRGGRVVWLTDPDWVDSWAAFHDVEVPHHSQTVELKEKLR